MLPADLLLPRDWHVGTAARTFNHPEAARVAFEATRTKFEKWLREQPEDAGTWSLLGQLEAALGRKEEAIKAGRRACEILPLSRDESGLRTFAGRNEIYATMGEKDMAIQMLATRATRQVGRIHYGYLKLDPVWDPLRGDPRFEKIVASLAPRN